MPVMMPQPVMKASSSTSAGPAAAASGAISSRYTRPEQVIATASAIPVLRSQRGSAIIVAAAAARTASASILTPSSRSTEAKSRCAGPGAEASHQRDPCGAGGARAARGPGQGNRDDGDARGRKALGQGELRGNGRAVPGQRHHDLCAAGTETGGGRRDGQPGDPGQRVPDAGQAGDGQQPPVAGAERGSGRAASHQVNCHNYKLIQLTLERKSFGRADDTDLRLAADDGRGGQ